LAIKVAALPGIEKAADGPSWNPLTWLPTIAAKTTDVALNKLLPLALIAPPVAGLAGGYALSQMQDDSFDKIEARKKEEIAEMQRAVARLRRLQQKRLQMA
jgi:hypothetical protein